MLVYSLKKKNYVASPGKNGIHLVTTRTKTLSNFLLEVGTLF